ncbi:hypothetical protein ACFLT9_13050 [Acidobacteriota bacterium]
MRKTTLRQCFFLLVWLGVWTVSLFGQGGVVRLKVVSELANIRLKPDIGSVIIRQFPQESLLESREKVGEWYKIRFEVEGGESLSGYVHESLVLVVDGILVETEVVRKEDLKIDERKREEEKKPPVEKPPVTKRIPEQKPQQITLPRQDSRRPPPQEEDIRIALFLSGGGIYSKIGDLNSGSKGLADYYSDFLGVTGRGVVSDLKLSLMFGGDLVFPTSPKVSIIIGADYFTGGRKSLVDFTAGPSPRSFTSFPQISAIPIRAGLSYSPFPFLYAKVAVEYFFARCSYSYRYQDGEFWQQWEGKAKSGGFGGVGALGVIFRLNSFFGLYIEAGGRLAKLDNFTGTNHFTDSDGGDLNETGTLYLYQGQISGNKTYPLLFIREKNPTEAGVSGPREAILDLSGVSLKAGIRFRF